VISVEIDDFEEMVRLGGRKGTVPRRIFFKKKKTEKRNWRTHYQAEET